MSSGCLKVIGRSFALACACVALGVSAGTASAGTVVANTTADTSQFTTLGITLNDVRGLGPSDASPNGNWSGSVLAGAIEWNRNFAAGTSTTQFLDYNSAGVGALSTSKFTSYCIDIVEDVYINNGPYVYDQKDLTGAPLKLGVAYDLITPYKKALLEALWGQHIKDSFELAADGGEAAFQAAVWNIVFDGDFTVSPGGATTPHFSVTSGPADVISYANMWLGDARDAVNTTTNQITGPAAKLFALTSPTMNPNNGVSPNAQDQLVAVPLPAAVQAGGVLIGMLGLGKLVTTVRRRRASV